MKREKNEIYICKIDRYDSWENLPGVVVGAGVVGAVNNNHILELTGIHLGPGRFLSPQYFALTKIST